jgi:tubulin alpha
MGKEILTVHFGSFGDGVGRKMWQNLSIEHGISMEGILDKENIISNNNGKDLGTYFIEGKKGKYIPRAMFVDSDSSTIDEIQSFEFKNLFSEKSLIKGDCESVICPQICKTNTEFCKTVEEGIRKATEKSESLQGINIMSSLHSGLGSGMIYHLVPTLIKEEKSVFGVNLLPSVNRINPFAAYNSILGFSK